MTLLLTCLEMFGMRIAYFTSFGPFYPGNDTDRGVWITEGNASGILLRNENRNGDLHSEKRVSPLREKILESS